MRNQAGENGLEEFFSPDIPQEQQKKNFLLMLSRIEQETDHLTAIAAYRQLLRVNLEMDSKYYQEIIFSLSRLLNKKQFFGEEIYYRYIVRFFFESVLDINPAILNDNTIKKLYTTIFLELKRNSNKVNIIIVCEDLNLCMQVFEVVKVACDQQAVIFSSIDDLLKAGEKYQENYAILLVVDTNIKSSIENIKTAKTLRIFKEYKSRFSNSIIKAVYCFGSEIANKVYPVYCKEAEYTCYNETMIYALLHIALKSKLSTFNQAG